MMRPRLLSSITLLAVGGEVGFRFVIGDHRTFCRIFGRERGGISCFTASGDDANWCLTGDLVLGGREKERDQLLPGDDAFFLEPSI